MTSSALTDLDPPPARERRWPFYVAWTMGGIVVGAVLMTHLPASSVREAGAPVLEPAPAPATIPTAVPATPQLGKPLQLPPFRVAPVPIAPARP